MSKRAAALDELAAETPTAKPAPEPVPDPVVHLTIRVPRSLRARAHGKASAEGRSVQDVVTELLTAYVD